MKIFQELERVLEPYPNDIWFKRVPKRDQKGSLLRTSGQVIIAVCDPCENSQRPEAPKVTANGRQRETDGRQRETANGRQSLARGKLIKIQRETATIRKRSLN